MSHESYSLVPELRKRVFVEMNVDPRHVKIDCFANKDNHQEDLYMSKANSVWRYNFSHLLTSDEDVLWSNPPFSMFDKLVTKLIMEPCRMLIVHPDWQDDYWAPFLRISQ